MSDNLNNMSPWFKLFALSIVGGVAKSLFAPQWRPVAPTIINQGFDALKDATATVATDAVKKH